jgi:hypothetical protein
MKTREKSFNHGGAMISTASIMVHVPWWQSGFVKFVNSDHTEPNEERGRSRRFYLDIADWEDMGKPETITLTATVGDKLNDPVEAQWGGDVYRKDRLNG